ncbi:Chromate reductase [Thalassocella blandensis]|nr:Chromate reductase [Thalassocella blandensis]
MANALKVIAFAASTSKQSINKKLVTYATSLLEGCDVEILDLNDYEMPLFSVDKEEEIGQHSLAQELLTKIGGADVVIISFAEHNSSFSAAYKNTLDWCSRIESKVYQGKDAVYLSTSPGKRGGANVMRTALETAERFGANVKAHFSLPSFQENFDTESMRISNPEFDRELRNTMRTIQS